MSDTLTTVNSQPNLAVLATKVRNGLDFAAQAGGTMLAYLIEVGEALIEAKKQAGTGNWLKWLKQECDLSEDSAGRYMRLARGKGHLDSARVRNLSLTGALKLIKRAEPDRNPEQKRRLPDDPKPVAAKKAAATEQEITPTIAAVRATPKRRRQERREIMRADVERLVDKLVRTDRESAHALYNVLFDDDHVVREALVVALERGLGISDEPNDDDLSTLPRVA